MTERDARADFVNSLLTSPHRKLSLVQELHQEMVARDPLFYVRMAAWYADHGKVRDHQEVFAAMLCVSSFEGHREVGLALLSRLPPYQVARVVRFVKGTTVKTRAGQSPPPPPPRRRGLLSRLLRPEIPTGPEKVGLGRNVPRSMRREIEHYLRDRERDPEVFDRTAATARTAMKRLYASLHIAPSPRAQAVLFDNRPPEGSLAFAIKQMVHAQSPAEQARTIAEYRIPYRVASGVISQMTPMVLAALIEVMSPQELINSLGSLKTRGALQHEEIKKLIDQKLDAARSDDRVSAYKAKVAAAAAGVEGALSDKLDEITETHVKAAGRISRPTALLIDKSASMRVAIEVGKQLGAMISAISEADLFTYAFDTAAYPVTPKGSSLKDWEKALDGINAGNPTSCGVAIDRMRNKGQRVEQIVMITDEDENSSPTFADAYGRYARVMGIRPSVVFIKVGSASAQLEDRCRELEITPQVFTFSGDYYALPNVIPMLSFPTLGDMVMEILEYPLPQRQSRAPRPDGN